MWSVARKICGPTSVVARVLSLYMCDLQGQRIQVPYGVSVHKEPLNRGTIIEPTQGYRLVPFADHTSDQQSFPGNSLWREYERNYFGGHCMEIIEVTWWETGVTWLTLWSVLVSDFGKCRM